MRDDREALPTVPVPRSPVSRSIAQPSNSPSPDDGDVSPLGLAVAAGLVGSAAAFSALAVGQIEGAPRRAEEAVVASTEVGGTPISDAINTRLETMSEPARQAFIGPVLDAEAATQVTDDGNDAAVPAETGQGSGAQREPVTTPDNQPHLPVPDPAHTHAGGDEALSGARAAGSEPADDAQLVAPDLSDAPPASASAPGQEVAQVTPAAALERPEDVVIHEQPADAPALEPLDDPAEFERPETVPATKVEDAAGGAEPGTPSEDERPDDVPPTKGEAAGSDTPPAEGDQQGPGADPSADHDEPGHEAEPPAEEDETGQEQPSDADVEITYYFGDAYPDPRDIYDTPDYRGEDESGRYDSYDGDQVRVYYHDDYIRIVWFTEVEGQPASDLIVTVSDVFFYKGY
jgi:hypothetical protein